MSKSNRITVGITLGDPAGIGPEVVAKALQIFTQLTTDIHYLTPEVALVNLGKMYTEKNDFKRAQSYFQQAVAAVPGYLDAHFYLAWAAYINKNISLAKQEIKTLLYLDPGCKAAKLFEEKLGGVSG